MKRISGYYTFSTPRASDQLHAGRSLCLHMLAYIYCLLSRTAIKVAGFEVFEGVEGLVAGPD
jgi:hypothetical protein